MSKVLASILIVGAFAGGMYLAGSQNAPVITQSGEGASYSGGYDKAGDKNISHAKN